jgi:hypothetical protein
MRNKPNFQKSQMFITVVSTTNYNEKLKLDTWSKQTQMPLGMAYATKPILSTLLAGKIALSGVEGPIKTNIHLLFHKSLYIRWLRAFSGNFLDSEPPI